DRHGDAGVDRRLPGGDLSGAGLEHLAHEHVVDLVGGDTGAFERSLDREATQVGGLEACEGPGELADRRPGAGDDHGTSHGGASPKWSGWDPAKGIPAP